MLRQKAGASGASGMSARTPTIAAALSRESVISSWAFVFRVRSRSLAPVDRIGDRLEIGQQPALRTVDRGQVEALLELADVGAVGPGHHADGFAGHRQRRVAGVDSAGGGQRRGTETPLCLG